MDALAGPVGVFTLALVLVILSVLVTAKPRETLAVIHKAEGLVFRVGCLLMGHRWKARVRGSVVHVHCAACGKRLVAEVETMGLWNHADGEEIVEAS